jgi:hypothetical protein
LPVYFNKENNLSDPLIVAQKDGSVIVLQYQFSFEPKISNHSNRGITGIRLQRHEIETGKEINTKIHEFKDHPYIIEDIFCDENYIYILSYICIQKQKKYIAELLRFNIETLDIEPTIELFDRKARNYIYGSSLDFKYTDNHKQYLITEAAMKLGNIDYISRIYNSNWELQFIDTLPSNYETLIDNEGSFYYFNTSDNYIITRDVYKDYEKWEEKIDLSILKPKDKITNISEEVSSDGHVFLTGLYINESKNETDNDTKDKINLFENKKIKGIYVLKVDKNSKEILFNKISEFESIKGETTICSESCMNEIFKIDRTSIIKNSLSTPDGGVLILIEEASAFVPTKNSSTEYHFEDLFLIKISSSGEIQWISTIPKEQVWKNNSNPIRYYFNIKEDKIQALIYNGINKISLLLWNDYTVTFQKYIQLDLVSGKIKNIPLLEIEGNVLVPQTYKVDFNSNILLFKQEKDLYQMGKIL